MIRLSTNDPRIAYDPVRFSILAATGKGVYTLASANTRYPRRLQVSMLQAVTLSFFL